MTTPIFAGDAPTEALIELHESSGPVSPAYQFHLHVAVKAGSSGVRLVIDDERDWEDGVFRTKVHTNEPMERAAYEALWADLQRLGAFAHPAPAAPEVRVGASLNTLVLRLGEQTTEFSYRLSDLSRKSRPPQAALVERVRALAGR